MHYYEKEDRFVLKIVNAEWEKRNLGVSTIEIICEQGDSCEDIDKAIDENVAEYYVCKIPTHIPHLSEYIQKCGFVYIEDQIEVLHDLHESTRNSLQQRLYDSVSYREMTSEDIEQLLLEIDYGMFDSDRISLDSHFITGVAKRRYTNWVNDLLRQGAIPYVMMYKGEPSGFIILQTKDGKSYTSVLGGAYEKFRKSGLGIVQKEQEIVKKIGGKSVNTNVSSNNPNQLKALCMNGYVPKSVSHVFVKYKKD